MLLHIIVLLFLTACKASVLPPYCIDNNNNSLVNCTIETGGAEIQCPKKNVIRVIGDYQNFSIHCQSDGDLFDFEYDGTKPTEAIRVNAWKDVELITQANDSPKVVRHHIKVEVLSVQSLIQEYKNTLKIQSSNLTVPPEVYYSRSGKFIFDASSRSNKDLALNFSIFFEEPLVEPSFINRYEKNEEWKILSVDKYFVACRSTHYVQPDEWTEPELWINGERKQTVDYDPTAGFYVSASFREMIEMSENNEFRCFIPHRINPSKAIEFDPTLTLSATQLALRPLSLTSSVAPMWSYFSREGKFNVRCLPSPESTLYFIAARNPNEQVLVRDFVLPAFVNRSLYVEKGMLNEDTGAFQAGIETHRGTPLHFGAVYCADRENYTLSSFVTDIRSQSSFTWLSHSIDWREIQGRGRDQSWPEDKLPSRAGSQLYLELKNLNGAGPVYDFENLTFQCHVHPFFSRPVVWQSEQNNSVQRRVVETEWTEGPSTFTTRLNPGLATISCLASLSSWPDMWAQVTTNVTVLASEEPKFEQHQPLVYEFAPDDVDPQVNDGDGTVSEMSDLSVIRTGIWWALSMLGFL